MTAPLRRFSDAASIAWNSLEYAVVWRDEREPGNSEIYFARLDETGAKIGDGLRVTAEPGYSGQPKVVWTGTEYGIAWRDDRDGNPEIYFTRIAADGTSQAVPTRVTDTPGPSVSPAMGWTGAEYVVVWREEVAAAPWVAVSRIDAAGVEAPGAEIFVNPAPGMSAGSGPAMALAAGGFLVAWNDTRYGSPEVIAACRAADGDTDTTGRPSVPRASRASAPCPSSTTPTDG